MRKLSIRVLLPVLCVVTMLFSVVGSVLVSGGVTFPWRQGELNGRDKTLTGGDHVRFNFKTYQ